MTINGTNIVLNGIYGKRKYGKDRVLDLMLSYRDEKRIVTAVEIKPGIYVFHFDYLNPLKGKNETVIGYAVERASENHVQVFEGSYKHFDVLKDDSEFSGLQEKVEEALSGLKA